MNVIRIVGACFALVGTVLGTVAGVIYARDAAFAARAQQATGEVIGLVPSRSSSSSGGSLLYSSRVRFRTGEGRVVEFVESVASQPPRHSEGEHVRVLYDATSAADAVIDDRMGRWGAVIIISALSAIFAPLGLILLGVSIRASRRKTRLERSGRFVEAEFLHVFRDERLTVNGHNPFRVAAQWTDPSSGELRRFDSSAIWVDPTERLRGRPVKVLLGARGSYLVDLRGIVDPSAFAE